MTNFNIKIPVKLLNEKAKCPEYAYIGDAGFDLCSCVDTELPAQERFVVPCGISIAIPEGYAGLILPRSGLALKHGISIVNSPGLIDSGYRGEICVILLNTDKSESFKINIGDRIAQMMIIPFARANFFQVDNLETSSRSDKGFGSSGI